MISNSVKKKETFFHDFHFFSKVDNVGTQMLSKHGISLSHEEKVTIATQTGIEEADRRFDSAKLSIDSHCYECKVKYRDPRPKDLVMFLHAWTYSVSLIYSVSKQVLNRVLINIPNLIRSKCKQTADLKIQLNM